MSDLEDRPPNETMSATRERFEIPDDLRRTHSPLSGVQTSLDRALDGAAVVLAPAGYGKTTQVALWASGQSRHVAWINLAASDNDPWVLAAKLISTLQQFADLLAPGPDLRTVGPDPSLALAAVTDVMRALERPVIVVIDGLHEIEDRDALQLVRTVVCAMPRGATVVLVGRADPGLNLASLRAEDRIRDIVATDLALGAVDARAIFESLGLEVDDAGLERYVEETEGWPLGLRLAALAVRDDAEGSIVELARDRTVRDLLHDEWLRGLDPDDKDFLLRVSGLDSISGQLCDELLDRSDSGARVERLHRSRLLLIPLDRHADAFRLHGLLRSVLDAEFERVDRKARRDIDRQCAAWFERHGDLERAVHHAARAGDEELVEELVVRYALSVHTQGGYETVRRWLDQIPVTRAPTDPALCLVASLAAVGLGRGEEARAWVRLGFAAAQASTDSETNARVQLELLTLDCTLSVGPINDSFANATRAYEQLPAGAWHSAATCALGFFYLGLGLDDLAETKLVVAAAEAHVSGAPTVWAVSCALLAAIRGQRGDWSGAIQLAREARQIVREHGLEDMPTMAVVTAMSAHAEALDGDPVTARADMTLSRRNMASLGDLGAWANVQSRLSLANASLLIGERAGARVLVDEANAFLASQSDATGSRQRLAEIVERLGVARHALPVGTMALTTAELRVLHLLPTNLSIADIAQRLYVSRNTTKSHTAAVYRKLGVSSRTEAVRVARDAGMLPLRE